MEDWIQRVKNQSDKIASDMLARAGLSPGSVARGLDISDDPDNLLGDHLAFVSASSPDANATARIRQLAGLDTGSRYENEAEDPGTITSAPRPITGAASRGSSDRGEDDAEEAAAEARELLASWMRIDEQAARIREEKKRDADVQERIAADRRFDGVQKSSVVQRPVPFEHTLRQDSSLSTVGKDKKG